jgi:hypothetical protein
MAFVLLIIGITLLVAGVQNTQGDLFKLLKGDFSAFFIWFVAIFLIGALGYIEKLKPLSTAFMGLVILVLFLSKGKGFFPQFQAALATGAQPNTTSAPPAGSGSGLSLPSLPSLGTLLTNSGVIQ